MKNKMRYRLALDLGTSSIGWAVLRIDGDNTPFAIVKAGVRIFSDGRDSSGNSLAVERREARQMRRRRDRLIKRQKRMLSALVTMGLLPEDVTERQAMANTNPYHLRATALDHEISRYEFGRIVMHLCKRRGFKSNRKSDQKDNELGVLKTAIRDMEEALNVEKCRTLGEWLNRRHQQGLSVRARLRGNTVKTKRYDYYADRSMIEQEFDALWKAQSKYDSKRYNSSNHAELKDILLFQRELLPVNPGRCTLLPDDERAPHALPSTQQFRILQELNNLRLVDDSQNTLPLSLEQRNQLFLELTTKKEFAFKSMKTKLRLPSGVRFNLASDKRDRLKGNLTDVIMSKKENFGSSWSTFPLDQQDRIVQRLMDEPSEDVLVSWLINDKGISGEKALHIARESLPQGHANLGRSAISRLLPKLTEAVITYDKAVIAAGFESHSQLTGVESRGELLQSLPYYGIPLQRHVAFAKKDPKNDEERYGKIANPTVHIGLNQLRTVVNTILKKYGLPSEINVEVTRDLKLSKKRRDEITKDQSIRQKRNTARIAEACLAIGLDPDNLSKSQRRNLSQKMQLWEELNPQDISDRRCPFSGVQISIKKLLGADIEIEHILPFSRTLDDSMANKTLATRSANRLKTNLTPWEAFGRKTEDGFNYENILTRASKMPIAKARRFSKTALDDWLGENDFLARSLNDTAYISRVARAYLSCICPPAQVLAIPGRLTAMIRGKLGLNSLLSTNGAKNRYDHRHHAVDAIVIGVTDRSFLSQIANANANARSQRVEKLINDMPIPWANFRSHALRAISTLKVSHRPDHGYQGKIMEDSSWGLLGDGIVRRHDRSNDTNERSLRRTKLNVIKLTSDSSERHGLTESGEPKPYKGYKSGGNNCVEVWLENGKWKSTVITTFQAYKTIRMLGVEDGWRQLRNPEKTQDGRRLVTRIMKNDAVKFKLNDDVSRIYKVQQIKISGEMLLVEIHESNADARHRDKQDPYKMTSKSAGSLQKANAEFVRVCPIGTVKRIAIGASL